MAPTKRKRPPKKPQVVRRSRKQPAEWSLPKPEDKKYDSKLTPILARKFCMLGCTNERLADLFEVSLPTISNWLKWFPEFKQAVLDGRDIANATVAESLYNKANGYTFEEHVYERQPVYGHEIDDDGSIVEILTGYEMVLKKTTTKHIPPDTSAATLWLSNRTRNKPEDERWSSRQEITGADGSALIPTEQSDKKAEAARAALLALVSD